jgi:hypothetical protein
VRSSGPQRLALFLAAFGALLMFAGIFLASFRELAIVVGLFFVFLAGGVLNWDRRSPGH